MYAGKSAICGSAKNAQVSLLRCLSDAACRCSMQMQHAAMQACEQCTLCVRLPLCCTLLSWLHMHTCCACTSGPVLHMLNTTCLCIKSSWLAFLRFGSLQYSDLQCFKETFVVQSQTLSAVSLHSFVNMHSDVSGKMLAHRQLCTHVVT